MVTSAHTFIGIVLLVVATGGIAQADNAALSDRGHAAKLYYEAHSLRNADSQARLATIYANGIGVEKSDAEALYWSRRAAEQGNIDAQLALSSQYADGRGTPKDTMSAYQWAYIAGAKAKDEATYQRAKTMLDLLAREMTQQQIASAVRWANAWHPQSETAPPVRRPQAAKDSAQEGDRAEATPDMIAPGKDPQTVKQRSFEQSERRSRARQARSGRSRGMSVQAQFVRFFRHIRI